MKTRLAVSLCLAAVAAATAGSLYAQRSQSIGTPSTGTPQSPVAPAPGPQAQVSTGPGAAAQPVTSAPGLQAQVSTGPVVPVPDDNTAERLQVRSEFSRELGLSTEQEAQIARIRERQRAEIAAINQNSVLTQEQRRAQIASAVRTYGEQIRALLNQDQLRIMDQIRERDRDRLRTLFSDNLVERLQLRSRLALELGLSAEQQGQIERIREQQRAAIAAMNQNGTLTQDQRREQFAAMLRKYGDQVRALMTQDQLQKMDQIRERERERLRSTQSDNIAELLQRRSELSRELGLSAEQEGLLARIREQQQAEIAAMNQNRNLTPEQRREQIATAIRNYGEQVRALMKADQLQKLDQIRDRDRDRDRIQDRKRPDRTASE